MLQILRNKAQSTVIQAIVVIIALVFIFWGVGSNMMNNREAAITVNGEEISFQDFQIAYDRAYQNIAAQFGGTLPKGLAETLGIKQQVINQMIQAALLRQGATAMGIIVSGEEIQNTITSMVQFQEGGGFNMDKYKALLSANRLTPHKFETNMRFDMLAEKTVRDIGKFAALASDYEVEELYRLDKEKVSVAYTKVSPADFREKIVVNDDELIKWFDTVKHNYKTESQLKMRFLNYSFSEVGKKIAIDDAQVSAYYDENISQFTTPEKRRARHILIKAGAEDSDAVHEEKSQRAQEILTLVNASDDFASLAKDYSEGPSSTNGGDLGYFAQDQMVKPFADAVFKMQPGEISKVVKTSFGYHIIKLEDITPAVTRSLEEVKGEIVSTLQNLEAQSLAFQLADSAYTGIISAGSLQAYADANPDQSLIITDFFTKSNPPAELSLDGEFLDKAFSLNAGELSSLIKTSSGYFIIFADEVKAPELPELEQVRDLVTADFIDEMASKQAKETATKILEELRMGTSFSDALAGTGLELSDSGLLDRRGEAQSSFPPSLVSQVFMLSATEPLPQNVAPVNEDFYVFSFQERQTPDVAAGDDLEKYRQQLLSSKQQQLLAAYIANLQKDADITVHTSL